MALFDGDGGVRVARALTAAGWLLVAFLAVSTISVLMGLRYIGTGVAAANTIAVSGHGEDLSVPDIAEFTFSVVTVKPTVKAAQDDVTAKANAITSYLASASIDAKDIQTSGYSIQPQYEYQTAVCSAATVSNSAPVYCPPGKQALIGYEVRQTTTVKVRDTSKAGDLLAGVGGKGATELSGLSFTFDDPSAPQAAARDKAIADAKQKAAVLAKELGVSLVRVVSFTENSNTPQPYPVAYGLGGGASTKAAAPEISVGQNKTTDDVTITYEIR